MLRIEIDLFSGRPNPVWIITTPDATKKLLDVVGSTKGAMAKQEAGFTGLGFREIRVDVLGDDEPRHRRVPKQFSLASTAVADLNASGLLAQKLIESMPIRSEVRLVEHAVTPLNAKLRDMILTRLTRYLSDPPRPRPPIPPKESPNPLRTTVDDAKCKKCQYEVSQFNPGFWNTAAVQPHNNCYNYARNLRTNTFAQPGRAHGAQASTMACSNVSKAALADGLKKRCNCLPQSEYPRRLMALVIDPGWDYHWYRHQRGGFWGHKPGKTAARNVDSSNVVIVNPESCNRGGYTDFCGYFYAGLSVIIN
jgi:hypothetical protein